MMKAGEVASEPACVSGGWSGEGRDASVASRPLVLCNGAVDVNFLADKDVEGEVSTTVVELGTDLDDPCCTEDEKPAAAASGDPTLPEAVMDEYSEGKYIKTREDIDVGPDLPFQNEDGNLVVASVNTAFAESAVVPEATEDHKLLNDLETHVASVGNGSKDACEINDISDSTRNNVRDQRLETAMELASCSGDQKSEALPDVPMVDAEACPVPMEEDGKCLTAFSMNSSGMPVVDGGDLACRKLELVTEASIVVENSQFKIPCHAAAATTNDVAGCMQDENKSSTRQSQITKTVIVADNYENEGKKSLVRSDSASLFTGAADTEDNAGELVGNYVSSRKPPLGGGAHDSIILGKVSHYDRDTNLYTVVYEDGVHENLDHVKILKLIKGEDASASGMKMSVRKRKLDLLASTVVAEVKTEPPNKRARQDTDDVVMEESELSSQMRVESDVSCDPDSSSNSSESAKPEDSGLSVEFQMPELPPSSGDLAVPEESVSYLFSVYNFLRSFSAQLFLSPFGLDDFVCALNCPRQNNLLDAVHLSLLRTVRGHLQTLSSVGFAPAVKCLRYQDWSLLDSITWPIFLLEYLSTMHFLRDLGGQKFGSCLCDVDYYRLNISKKLRILQILCDEAIDAYKLRTELEAREDFDEEAENDVDNFLENRRVAGQRDSKAVACKKIEALQKSDDIDSLSSKEAKKVDGSSEPSHDANSDECRICGMDGTLVCCDGCPSAYHSRCIGLNKAFLPEGEWFCHECVVNKLGPTSARIERGAKGAEIFGVDMWGRMFVGTCSYLLVLGTLFNGECYTRYYSLGDVIKVLHVLGAEVTYHEICKRMLEYWNNLPPDLLRMKLHFEERASSMYIAAAGNSAGMKAEESGIDSQAVASKPNFSVDPNCVNTKSESRASDVFLAPKMEHCDVGRALENPGGQLPNGFVLTNKTYTKEASSDKLASSDFSAIGSRIDIGRNDVNSPHLPNHHHISSLYGGDGSSLKQKSERNGGLTAANLAKLASFRPHLYINNYMHGEIAEFAAENVGVLAAEGRGSERSASNPKKAILATYSLQMKAFAASTPSFVWPNADKKLMEIPRDRCGWCIACKGETPSSKKGCLLNGAAANSLKGSARNLFALRLIKASDDNRPNIVAQMINMEASLCGLLVGPLQDPAYKQQWLTRLKESSSCRTIRLFLLDLERHIRNVAFVGDWFKFVDDWEAAVVDASGSSRGTLNARRGPGRRGRKRAVVKEPSDTSSDDKEGTWRSGGKLAKYVLQRALYLTTQAVRKIARQGGSKRAPGIPYSENSDFPKRSKQCTWRAAVDMSSNWSHIALQIRYLDAHLKWREFLPPDQAYTDVKGPDAETAAFRNAVICGKKVVGVKTLYAVSFPSQKHIPVRVNKHMLEKEEDESGNVKLWFSENYVPLYLIKEFEEKSQSAPAGAPVNPSSISFPIPTGKRKRLDRAKVIDYLYYKIAVYSCAACSQDVPHRDSVTCTACQGKCHKDCANGPIAGRGISPSLAVKCKPCHAKHVELEAKKRQEQMNLLSQANRAMSIQLSPQIRAPTPAQIRTPAPAPAPAQIRTPAPAQIRTPATAQIRIPAPAQIGTPVPAQVSTPAPTRIKFKVGSHYASQLASEAIAQSSVKAQSFRNPTPPQRPPFKTPEPLKSCGDTKVDAKSSKKSTKSVRKEDAAPNNWGLMWKQKQKKLDEFDKDFRAKRVLMPRKDRVTSPPVEPVCCICSTPYRPDLMYIQCEKCTSWYHADSMGVKESQVGELVGFKCNKCRRSRRPRCPYHGNYSVKAEPDAPGDESSNQESAGVPQPSSLPNAAPYFTTDEEVNADIKDPLLCSSRIVVEPASLHSVDANMQWEASNQKLSVRRAQVRESSSHDQLSTSSASAHFADANGFFAPEVSSQLEWDYGQSDAYAGEFPVDGVDAADPQWGDPNPVKAEINAVKMEAEEFEPQTYFSFTELLAAEDSQLDDKFDLSAPMLVDSYDDYGGGGIPPVAPDESSSMHLPPGGPSYSSEASPACHQCKFNQPSPDLACEICMLHMHSSCLPWEESTETGGAAWRCSNCREWR